MITVVGGSGFIGTRFCKRLQRKQVSFEIVDLKYGESFPEKTKIADIREIESLRAAVTGDIIVHLAAVHTDNIDSKFQYFSTNVEGTRNICAVAAEKRIASIVFTSSVAVYGFAPSNTDESGSISPFNNYGKSKFEAEQILREWREAESFTRSLTIVRPTVVFGEGNRGNVFNLLNQISNGNFVMIGNGRNRKSMAYVGNVAAFLDSTLELRSGYRLCNYVDQPNMDMNELVSMTRQQLTGKKKVGLRLPFWVGYIVGFVADQISKLLQAKLPVSTIRVQKFCSETSFSSRSPEMIEFHQPYSLRAALEKTIDAEFINPREDQEVFYTE